MRLRELESRLQAVRAFDAPKAQYEQYATTPHLAAQLAHSMRENDDADGRLVCDLGCGAGMLTIAAVLAGAAHVIGIDIDEDALTIARENIEQHADGEAEFMKMDVCALGGAIENQLAKRFDTVITNPPFGTKRRGVDTLFLVTAVNMARKAVYSMHKTSTRDFIGRRLQAHGVRASVLAEMRFDIGRTLAFHRKQNMEVHVDLWRFDVDNVNIIEFSVHVDRPLDFIGTNGDHAYCVDAKKMQRRRRTRRAR